MERPTIERLTTLVDSRGDLTELVHEYDLPKLQEVKDWETRVGETFPSPKTLGEARPMFGQVYVVRNEQAMTIRAFHRHVHLWDYFTIVNGKARFWCVSPNRQNAMQFFLSAGTMDRLTVPPTWWHGWQSLTPNTILVCTGSHVYDRDNPDEERIAYDAFDCLRVSWKVDSR